MRPRERERERESERERERERETSNERKSEREREEPASSLHHLQKIKSDNVSWTVCSLCHLEKKQLGLFTGLYSPVS